MTEKNILKEIQKEMNKLKDFINDINEHQQKEIAHIRDEIAFVDDNLKNLLRAFDALNGSDWQKYNKIKEILSNNN